MTDERWYCDGCFRAFPASRTPAGVGTFTMCAGCMGRVDDDLIRESERADADGREQLDLERAAGPIGGGG
jgi:predicted Fe-S protein YdhL (DUF1289 family)